MTRPADTTAWVIRKCLADPCVHNFTKDILRQAENYDPVDALNDIELAYKLFKVHVDALLIR